MGLKAFAMEVFTPTHQLIPMISTASLREEELILEFSWRRFGCTQKLQARSLRHILYCNISHINKMGEPFVQLQCPTCGRSSFDSPQWTRVGVMWAPGTRESKQKSPDCDHYYLTLIWEPAVGPPFVLPRFSSSVVFFFSQQFAALFHALCYSLSLWASSQINCHALAANRFWEAERESLSKGWLWLGVGQRTEMPVCSVYPNCRSSMHSTLNAAEILQHNAV